MQVLPALVLLDGGVTYKLMRHETPTVASRFNCTLAHDADRLVKVVMTWLLTELLKVAIEFLGRGVAEEQWLCKILTKLLYVFLI